MMRDDNCLIDYSLPHNDQLRIITRPLKKTAQLILLTHNPELVKQLPGPRLSSLVADIISLIQSYLIRASHYQKPLTQAQLGKSAQATQAIEQLRPFLEIERSIAIHDYVRQEQLRQKVIAIILQARNENMLIATHPLVSEGSLGSVLFDAHNRAQHFEFNHSHRVSLHDQLDFSSSDTSSVIWDSELHVEGDKEKLNDALRVLCDYYGLNPPVNLTNIPANRFARFVAFIKHSWQETAHWLKELVMSINKGPQAQTAQAINPDTRSDARPLPNGEELYRLIHLNKHPMPWREKLKITLGGLLLRIPQLIVSFYKSIRTFILDELFADFLNHIHQNHLKKEPLAPPTSEEHNPIYQAIEDTGLLPKGTSLEQFIKEQIKSSNYVIAHANHAPSPPLYDNPFHRTFQVIRHLANFFIDVNARNPLIGSLALAGYAYGAGAVLAPDQLAALLTKLHLKGLIAGIEPIQKIARLMNHGSTSEAISASVTCWQGVVTGGNLDKFFIKAIGALKEDPADIALIAALALGLGYGVTKLIPGLQSEMGEFPYTNYAALGAKSGAALYDIAMHPGDDWLLGTCKWLCKNALILAKITSAPFFEGYSYGYQQGFISGLKKSWALTKEWMKHLLAGSLDFLYALTTIPLLELSTVLLYIPFRGFSLFFSTLISGFGQINSFGQALIDLSKQIPKPNPLADFSWSSLYGFSSPFGAFSEHKGLNLLINLLRLIFLPPLQVILNLALLPLVDCLSLLLHLTLALHSPIVKTFIYGFGTLLHQAGSLWDSSVGLLFSKSARLLTQECNNLEEEASYFKQKILSSIQVQRRVLYDWAFAEKKPPVKPIKAQSGEKLASSSHTVLTSLSDIKPLPVLDNRAPHPKSSKPLLTKQESNSIEMVKQSLPLKIGSLS
jgi:hypothetical protein